MFQTLGYYAIAFHRSFTSYTIQRLQQLGLNFGSLFPVLYVGKHPGCTQAELTKALGLDWGYSQRSITKLVAEGFLTREKIRPGIPPQFERERAGSLSGKPPGFFRLG